MDMISDLLKNTKPFGKLVAFFVIFFAFLMISTAVPILIGGDNEDLNVLKWSQVAIQIISFLFSSVLFCILYYGKPKRFFQINGSFRVLKLSMLAAIVMILLVPLTDWLTVWNDGLHFNGNLKSVEDALRMSSSKSEALMLRFLDVDNVGMLLFNLLVLALVPAFCEEFFFRGALQNVFADCFSSHHLSIILTASLFSVFHGELFAFLPRFFLGLVLGYLYYYGKSIWVNVVAHFVNNALIVVLSFLHGLNVIGYSPEEPLHLSWMWTVLCTMSASLIMVCYFFPNQSTKCSK